MTFVPTFNNPIGRGHYAEVFAEPWGEGRAALKLLHARYAAVKPFVAFFDREAEALALLDHPLFPKVLARGSVPSKLGNRPWLALEHRLGTAPEVGADLHPAMLRRLALDLLDGLDHLHSRHLLHRDLHPRNLLRTDEGAVTLLDLGNVWFLDGGPRNDLAAGEEPRLGSPETMAPEQFLGEAHRFGPATDLYGLGCTLLALKRGGWHFDERRFPLLQSLHLDPDAAWRQPRGDPFERWLLRLVACNPEDRPQTARQAAALLEALPD